MENIKLSGEIICKICGHTQHWQDGNNDTRAVINPESRYTDVGGDNFFTIELQVRCTECKYMCKEIIGKQIKDYKKK